MLQERPLGDSGEFPPPPAASGHLTTNFTSATRHLFSWVYPLPGCGCGLVISANQTLTLREITRTNAGTAAA